MTPSQPAWQRYACMEKDDVLRYLGSQRGGFSSVVAHERLLLDEKQQRSTNRLYWLKIFVSRFVGLFNYILLGIALFYVLTDSYAEGVLVVIIYIINGFLSFWQEYRAEQSSQAVQRYLEHVAHVMRDGVVVEVPLSEVVVGDIVHVKAGDVLCVDVRILELHGASFDESIVDAASSACEKTSAAMSTVPVAMCDAHCIAYAGTYLTEGEMVGVVIARGDDSSAGVQDACVPFVAPDNVFAAEMPRIIRFVGVLLCVVVGFIFIVHLVVYGWSPSQLWQCVLISITFAIAAVPEALPLVITSSLARGAARLATRAGVVVKHLSAVEALGHMDILCCGITNIVKNAKHSSALVLAQQLKVMIKVVSGEGVDTCYGVAVDAGLIKDSAHVMTGEEWAGLSHEDQLSMLECCHVFAECNALHKTSLMCAFKNSGYVVAYVGDSACDMGALRESQIGIAAHEAPHLVHGAADIIMLHTNLLTIINGVVIGRSTLYAVMTYLRIVLATSFSNICSLAVASFFLVVPDVFPLHMLILNLLSDIPLLALTTDNVDLISLSEPQRFDRNAMLKSTVMLACANSFMDTLFLWGFYRTSALVLETSWVLWSTLSEVGIIFSLRTTLSVFRAILPSWQLTVLCSAISMVAIALPFSAFGRDSLGYAYLTSTQVGFIIALVVVYGGLTELMKPWIFGKRNS